MMRNVAFLTKYYHMSYQEIMELPYSVLKSYLKWAKIFILEETEEGRKQLAKMRINSPNVANKKEPDFGRIRGMTGYKRK